MGGGGDTRLKILEIFTFVFFFGGGGGGEIF